MARSKLNCPAICRLNRATLERSARFESVRREFNRARMKYQTSTGRKKASSKDECRRSTQRSSKGPSNERCHAADRSRLRDSVSTDGEIALDSVGSSCRLQYMPDEYLTNQACLPMHRMRRVLGRQRRKRPVTE